VNPRSRRVLFWIALAAWCAATWLLSSRSHPDRDLGVSLPDWLAHGIEYAVGGFCAYGAFRTVGKGRTASLAIAFCVLWGLGDEWHQSFVPGRDSALADVLADGAGGALGTLVHTLLGPASRPPSG